ncbi:MAG TPA: hypothetical protein VIC56_06460 [Gemmatimonadota bacterium]|jgi:hypothetical protein
MPRHVLPALALAALLAGACDFLESPGEVQNSRNNAFVEAQVFVSRADRTPVQGVIMIVESDPDSERPFQGPDQSFVSDDSGFIRAEVFPGRDLEEQQGEVPTDPFDVPPLLFFGDACVHFLHDGDFFSFSCGVTLGAGEVLNLGIFFAEDFGALPPEEGA